MLEYLLRLRIFGLWTLRSITTRKLMSTVSTKLQANYWGKRSRTYWNPSYYYFPTILFSRITADVAYFMNVLSRFENVKVNFGWKLLMKRSCKLNAVGMLPVGFGNAVVCEKEIVVNTVRRVGGGARRVRTNSLWKSIMEDWKHKLLRPVNFQLLANTGGMENKLRALQLLNYPARRR